jgi:DMSO/TMAO reductase YedYZ heme-binding membrane subunit
MNTRTIAQAGAVAYLLLVVFVILHNAEFSFSNMLMPRYLAPLGLGVASFWVLRHVIKEIHTDQKSGKDDEEKV